MSKITDDIRLAYGSTLMDDGYTLWHDGKTRVDGFVVGGVEHESVCELDDGVGFSTLFVEYESLMKEDSAMTLGLGTWVEQGRIYFDIVQLFDTESGAIWQCNHRGEKAYYDIAKSKSIYINDKTWNKKR